MKRIVISLILFSMILLICGFEGGPQNSSFTEKEVPVIRNLGMDPGTVTLRFYEDLPNVAYISAEDYLDMWIPGAEMKSEQTAPHTYELTSPTGKAEVNTEADSFFSEDFSAFTNLMGLVQDGMPNTYYDGMPFIKFVSLESEPASVPTTFDFSAYHIDLRSDGSSVYFPFALISDMYSDLFYHHSGFNGEKVVMNYSNFDIMLNTVDPSYSAPLVRQERPEDLTAYTYNELCFALDHFYGRPGREPISSAMADKGLDRALDDFGETGRRIKELLQSTSTAEFYAGMDGLNVLFYDGGHTKLQPGISTGVLNRPDAAPLAEEYSALQQNTQQPYDAISDIYSASAAFFSDLNGLTQLRNEAYGIGETYVKSGDTAVCVFNSFDTRNQEAWDAYYAGEGPLPNLENTEDDAMVIFLDALYKAQNDPEVRNLIIDISTNTGGSADVLLTMVSLITGQSEMYYLDRLTGQKAVVTYAVDRNFDGVFDEQDAEVRFDLNFAVLTSRVSFSCGNLFPSIMRDAGYPILGEQSGGGACAVQMLNTADGHDYNISSFRSCLMNQAGDMIDDGVPVDTELVNRSRKIEVLIPGFDVHGNPAKQPYVMDNYRDFYNLEVLKSIVNGQ